MTTRELRKLHLYELFLWINQEINRWHPDTRAIAAANRLLDEGGFWNPGNPLRYMREWEKLQQGEPTP